MQNDELKPIPYLFIIHHSSFIIHRSFVFIVFGRTLRHN